MLATSTDWIERPKDLPKGKSTFSKLANSVYSSGNLFFVDMERSAKVYKKAFDNVTFHSTVWKCRTGITKRNMSNFYSSFTVFSNFTFLLSNYE